MTGPPSAPESGSDPEQEPDSDRGRLIDAQGGPDPDTDRYLRAAVDALDDLFFVFDEDWGLRRWNRAVRTVTGYSDEDLDGRTPERFIEPADHERLAAAIREVLDTGDARVEATVVTADGDRIPYEFEVVRATDEEGSLIGFCGIGRDITDRRAVERERRAVLDRMTDAFFALDRDWRITYVNDRAETILARAMGLDPEASDVEGLDLWEHIPEAVDTPFYERYHEVMETQEPTSFEEYYPPLGSWFEVRAYPSESGLSVYFRDITDRRERRETLEERERVLREIYELTGDTERSFGERVEALLELGCELLGLSYGTLSRINGDEYHFEVVHTPEGDDLIEAGDIVALSATNCERTATRRETVVLADIESEAPELTGRAGYAEMGITSYVGAPVVVEEEVYGTFCFYDTEPKEAPVSEWAVTLVDLMSQWVGYELTRQRAQERLERQNERLEDLVSIVSHDLRNPLNVLEGSIELAENTGEAEHFERARRAIDRMDVLIEDFLTLARAGETAETRDFIDLASLLERCWDTVDTKDATIDAEIDLTVRADESRLRQLFENLIRNAVEHAGPAVRVEVGVLESGDGFYFEDDGPGIPEAEREAVFKAGHTTAENGTGIGLSIVKRIADAHGWRIALTEGDDGGARFEFTDVG